MLRFVKRFPKEKEGTLHNILSGFAAVIAPGLAILIIGAAKGFVERQQKGVGIAASLSYWWQRRGRKLDKYGLPLRPGDSDECHGRRTSD